MHARYCDEYVFLHISETTRQASQNFLYMLPMAVAWLSSNGIAMHISGFVYHVVFLHSGPSAHAPV